MANMFGIGVQLMNQIVLVPFYILFWGNDLYSDWIVLSALTIIFSMSDIGLNTVIQNRFAIKYSEGDKKECNSLLMDNFVLVTITLAITLLSSALFLVSFDITEVMNIRFMTRYEASWTFLILTVKVFIGMLSGVENSIYRACHNASRSIYMDQIGVFSVALITLICILCHTSVILLSIFICLPQLFLIIYKYFDSQKLYKYKLDIKAFNWQLLREIILPSFSFMAFPIGNAVVLQGYTLVVNRFFGADSVVLYNTTRTLCNFIKQLIGTLQNSVWPEYSIAYGKGNYPLMRHLHRKVIKITIATSLFLGLLLLMFGPLIYNIWTHGAVQFEYALMATYIGVLMVESLWTSSSVTLMATNNHTALGVIYIIAATTCMALAVWLGAINSALWTIAATLVVMHIVICSYTIPAAFTITQDQLFKK